MKIQLSVRMENATSLQDYLKEIVGVPKGLLHELRMSKKVLVNGAIPNWTHTVQTGDMIILPVISEAVSPDPSIMDISVLYEDEHMLIVDKAADIETHPSSETDHKSLSNGVAHYFLENGIKAKVRHIHRLDKDTSGAILFAKHSLSGSILDRELAERKIKRTYLALVEGLMSNSSGTIDKAIGKDRHHASRRRISPSGQKAVTHYKVLKKFEKEKLSLVQLTLDTGRTHQIRVHMSSLGHPLFGDILYGAKGKHSRHSLHAWKLTVPHPFKDGSVTVEAPIPTDFAPADIHGKIVKL
ncbi:RluA family pseudouridine synthase [Bacillus tianshenii]|uniref:RluA family pseudouridine synthase n=1 Tax=Sutcliffiella tianshenii TaxID=1463404 RepID=UPI001CD78ECE|nr:RluA family pseudouridine synthase [Bacillus tianshenii]MCA1321440.1 RluA family pseudouridine synthase [Bacillus tianshenii]